MPKDIVFTADGSPGYHGQNGQDGHSGRRGRDGGRGQDAGRPSSGEDGGSNRVLLESSASTEMAFGSIRVSGNSSKVSQSPGKIFQELPARSLEKIVILARGGAGGDGGHGGNGGRGGRGHDGQDATRFRNGTNGGDGGDGGDGGKGTDGAPGGNGGVSEILVREKDLYLLMAVENCEAPAVFVQGGTGGRRGTHGTGGPGGRGGSGGSSYRWTEWEDRTESYTDMNGNRETRTVKHAVHHSNSGGSSGWSGSSGWTPETPLEHGRDGNPGEFRIRVLQETGQERFFRKRYDLELRDFHLTEDPENKDADGILEFGETVYVKAPLLRNVGGMHSPHQRVRLYLSSERWLSPLGDELFLEKSLEKNEETTLGGYLRFQIPDVTIEKPGDPFTVKQDVQIHVSQLGHENQTSSGEKTPFQRLYQRTELRRRFRAQFPIENRDGIQALRSLASGERTKLSFDVSNVSNKSIGSASERKRKVGVQLEILPGDLGTKDIVFFDVENQEIDLSNSMQGFSGYFMQIPEIAPHSSFHVHGQFGLLSHVAPYAGANIRVTLWLESLENSSEWKVIQRREITIRAEPAYVYHPDSQVLLVSNNNTTKESFIAWKTLLEHTLGLQIDCWSISRYGHFDQRLTLPDGTDLRTHLEDRVVLLLNQRFHPRSSDETDLPSDYVQGRDFREGAVTNNTHFAIIGSRHFSIRQLLEPTSDFRRGGDDFPTVKRFLFKELKTGGPLVQETFKDDILTYFDQVELQAYTVPFFTPDPVKALRKRGKRLHKKLREMHPNRRYIVILKPVETAERVGWWLFFPRFAIGTVEVRRSLNIETSSAVVLEIPGERSNQAEFIESEEVRFTILLALPFEQKLDRLHWILSSEPDELDREKQQTLTMLIKAILVDLSEEQSALRTRRGTLNQEVLTQKLSNLGRIVKYPFHTQISVRSNKWDHLIELSSGLMALAKAHLAWWKLWGRNRKISRYILAKLDVLLGDLFDAHAIDPEENIAIDSQTARERIQSRVKALRKLFQERKAYEKQSRFIRINLGKAAHLYFERPSDFVYPLYRDIDQWRDPEGHIWTEADLEKAQQGEQEREAKQKNLQKINAKIRARMLLQDQPKKATQSSQTEVQEEVILQKQ